MSQLAQYLAAILLDTAKPSSDESFGGSVQTIRNRVCQLVGYSIQPEDISDALEILAQFGAADSDYSPLTGGFWHISYDNFRYYFIDRSMDPADDVEIFQETKKKCTEYPILNAYARRGSRYVADAIHHLKNGRDLDWDELRASEKSEAPQIPASNRIVKLDHNQAKEIDDASSAVIEEVEKSNFIDDDLHLRDRIIGQIKAGRELVRALSLNAYLLYATVVNSLSFLIEKYAGQAIGLTAKKLLDLLIEQVFKK